MYLSQASTRYPKRWVRRRIMWWVHPDQRFPAHPLPKTPARPLSLTTQHFFDSATAVTKLGCFFPKITNINKISMILFLYRFKTPKDIYCLRRRTFLMESRWSFPLWRKLMILLRYVLFHVFQVVRTPFILI